MDPLPTIPLPPADLEAVLTRTEALWSGLQGGRVFVTGGSGFFGTWLVESFAWAQTRLGFPGELWLLCRNPEAWAARFPHLARLPGLHLHAGQLSEFRPPAGAFHGLIHAAISSEPPLPHFRHILDGTNRMLDFAEGSGAGRLLFTSSGAVYGPPPRGLSPIPETSLAAPAPEDPATAYGQAKRASEFLFSAYAREKDTQAILARCFAFVGPHLALEANFAIGNFIRDAMAGQAIRIQGDGTPLRSYLYAGDLAAWLWTLYFQGPASQPIHVGSDQAISIASLATTVAQVLEPGLPVTVAGTPKAGEPPSCYVPAIDRARALGLEPWTGLVEAIQKTAAWHQLQRASRP